ncbi:acyl-CoA dehydrogenase [Actinocorallia sp. A-T 12471]|uniref:acyl-CoA dehydrogenase n=1 Tax=Actinocorallia sp. A-T 12471 TaxID=3089813 RepID=UPI0029D2B06F|nr:acyl-CoA dehydrogenase [Actinocorallia sp. A-T 12471]MDX6743825.1 acyl-CoA dehydrogenase [Actinocorallia sp. A-T 12471]
MAIGLGEEHEALAASVRGFVARHVEADEVRGGSARPGFYPALAAQGVLGLHVAEEHGGQGFGLVEAAVAVEELGRGLVPGPAVPTVLAAALLADSTAADVLPALADGTRTAAVALSADLVRDGGTVSGTAPIVLAGEGADVFLLPVGAEWVLLDAADVTVTPQEALDLTRGVASVTVEGVAAEPVKGVGDVRALAAVVLGAEACGVAGRALDDAVAYAKLREQFGRPIGQFQAVKHKLARLQVLVERARATVWDAARSLDPYAVAAAAVLATDAAVTCASDNIQTHGGIGYTFEHDAHLVYRRALTLRALVKGDKADSPEDRLGRLALAGVRREIALELPPEAEPLRAEIRARVADLAALDELARRAAMAEGGWVTPHLPKPWGRDAKALEQIVIAQELKAAGVRAVPLLIGAWVVPSLVQYGTEEQKERFLPPTFRGDFLWCQLFSEPGAGSDLAGLRTRAERVEGGWLITGQKIWTSLAREAAWGICLARTDPAAPKHDGITYFLVDMASPGIEVRPLREATGDAVFNEVFLEEVFVPDELVVGPVGSGWKVARNTLANERVGLTSSFQLGADLPRLVRLIGELGLGDDPVVRRGLGELAADEHAFQLLGLRATMKQLSGTDPGATATVRKLVAMEHGQRVTEFGYGLLGDEGVLTGAWKSPLRARWTRYLLASRAMTIGGGTTEINLNVIGERVLGLPRDA